MQMITTYPSGKQIFIRCNEKGEYFVKYSDMPFFVMADNKIIDFLMTNHNFEIK